MKVSKVLPLALLSVMGLVACGGGSSVAPTPTPTPTPSGSETPAPKEHNVTIWATAAEEAVVKKVVAAHNAANPNDKYVITYKSISEADCATEVAKNPTDEKAPDLFLVADDQIFNLQKDNITMEIKGEAANIVRSNNGEGAVLGASVGDKLFGFPVTNDNGYFTWHDTSVITKEDAASFETMLEKAHAAGKQFLLDITNSWYLPIFLGSPDACGLTSMYYQTDENGKTSYVTNWDSDTGAKVCEYVGGLIKKYVDNGTFINGGNDAIVAGMKDGTLAGAISGTWMEAEFAKAEIDTTNITATKLPSYHIDGKAYQMASFTGAKVFCVNAYKSNEQKLAAAKLANILTNTESQLTRFEERQTLPCNIAAAKDARYTEHVTAGGKALVETTTAAGIIQSKTAEDRYWKTVGPIGQAYMDGNLGEAANWKEFLNMIVEPLRVAQ